MANETRGKDVQAGPFELGARHDEVDGRLGRLHASRNLATGNPAVTLLPRRDDAQWQPRGPCQFRLYYQPEQDAVTLEVEQVPVSVTTSEVANLCALVTAGLERVEDDGRMDSHLVSGRVGGLRPRTVRVRRRRAWSFRNVSRELATASLALLGLALGVWWSPRASPPHSDARDADWSMEDTLLQKSSFLTRDNLDTRAVAYPLPYKPWTLQAAAPCAIDKGEVEINKGCWMELAEKAPCVKDHAEYQGKCYMPVLKPEPTPRSIRP